MTFRPRSSPHVERHCISGEHARLQLAAESATLLKFETLKTVEKSQLFFFVKGVSLRKKCRTGNCS